MDKNFLVIENISKTLLSNPENISNKLNHDCFVKLLDQLFMESNLPCERKLENGKNKNSTVVGDNVFVGSNASLIAPLKINDGSIVAAGSAINRDVPPESLAIARPIQQNKIGLGKKIMLKLQKVTDKIKW